ncbi:hypothetical protein GALL_405380 [mine drainage metagenome]|uniref:Uncharacterized protein n=1 Tax=mine drainage metagenome TaxID=410659 RepID=A0A1J5QCX7_9ZZZZ
MTANIQRHEKYVVNAPPTSGPSTGPTSAGSVVYVMARTSSRRGKLRSRMSRPTGVIIAPPRPCSTRIAISSAKLSASPHSAEPSVKRASAAMNTRRAPKRSAHQLLSGMNTASVST